MDRKKSSVTKLIIMSLVWFISLAILFLAALINEDLELSLLYILDSLAFILITVFLVYYLIRAFYQDRVVIIEDDTVKSYSGLGRLRKSIKLSDIYSIALIESLDHSPTAFHTPWHNAYTEELEITSNWGIKIIIEYDDDFFRTLDHYFVKERLKILISDKLREKVRKQAESNKSNN